MHLGTFRRCQSQPGPASAPPPLASLWPSPRALRSMSRTQSRTLSTRPNWPGAAAPRRPPVPARTPTFGFVQHVCPARLENKSPNCARRVASSCTPSRACSSRGGSLPRAAAPPPRFCAFSCRCVAPTGGHPEHPREVAGVLVGVLAGAVVGEPMHGISVHHSAQGAHCTA